MSRGKFVLCKCYTELQSSSTIKTDRKTRMIFYKWCLCMRVCIHVLSPSRVSNACCECVSLSESSDQLVYPHAKLARRCHPALPHTDGIYLTLTELCFTSVLRLYCSATVYDCSFALIPLLTATYLYHKPLKVSSKVM